MNFKEEIANIIYEQLKESEIKKEQIEDMYSYMIKCEPLPQLMYDVMMECFHEYMVILLIP